MNYYIQGDSANADKIKAAFERNGIDTSANSNYGISNLFYYSYNGEVAVTQNRSIINIIKTHPDYKELELPVEPKFKVGDWLAANEPNNYARFVHVEGIEDSLYVISKIGGAFGSVDRPCITFVEEYYHPFSIEDAEDGDVLVTTNIRSCPFIYRKNVYNNNLAYYYVGIDGNGDFCEGCIKRTLSHFGPVADVVPATKEQRGLLFAKMREAGYEWDADKKELRKIKPHYDIANIVLMAVVLVSAFLLKVTSICLALLICVMSVILTGK